MVSVRVWATSGELDAVCPVTMKTMGSQLLDADVACEVRSLDAAIRLTTWRTDRAYEAIRERFSAKRWVENVDEVHETVHSYAQVRPAAKARACRLYEPAPPELSHDLE